MFFRVGLNFSVDNSIPPVRNSFHDALETVRAIEIETSSQELAEHYASLIMAMLEREADGR